MQIIKLLSRCDERLKKTREVIEQQMTHLVRLIDDLMDVSRISRGKVTLRQERLLLNSVLSTAVESAWPALAAKPIRLVQIMSQTLAVDGDVGRLTQVFANLLTNAIEFSPPQSTITLTFREDQSKAIVPGRVDVSHGETGKRVVDGHGKLLSRHRRGGVRRQRRALGLASRVSPWWHHQVAGA